MAKKQETNNTAKLWVKIICGIMGFLMIFGVLVMLISSLQSAALENNDAVLTVPDQQISVGLYCNDNAVQSYALTSDDGIRITNADSDWSIGLASSKIIVSVDGNLYRTGSTLSTVSQGIATVGGYHIEISYFTFSTLGIDTDHDNPVFIRPGSSAGSTDGYSPANVHEYISLLTDDSTFKALGVPVFPYYATAEKCYIRVGNFYTKEEAETVLGQLSRTLTMNAVIAEPDARAVTVLSEDYSVLCELSGTGGSYAISSGGGEYMQDENGRVFYGSISVMRSNETDAPGLSIINRLSLEDYIAALIPSEVSSEWNEELLKSMAVILRTELVRKMGCHANDGYDVCADEHCHQYIGGVSASQRVLNAVKDTAGQILTYEEQPIYTPYSVENGSGIVSSADAFGKEVPYLQSVYTPWESTSAWTVEFTPYELYQILRGAGYDELSGNIATVTVNSYATSTDYVNSITFTDLFGESVTVEGSESIRLLFAGRLPSACFIVGVSGDSISRVKREWSGKGLEYSEAVETITLTGTYGSFVFTGSGSGCGVGFSVMGAKALAEQGFSYHDILSIYFPGAEILGYGHTSS